MKILTYVLSVLAAAGLSAATLAAEPETEAVEYYNLTLGHYFITATAGEAQLIDDGAAGAGWVRTGRSFQAWLDPAKAPANAAGVCRFYSVGANSHFYTADAGECEYLKGLEAAERSAARSSGAQVLGWRYEGIAFRIEAPTNQACPAGTLAVARVYNDGFRNGEGSNHRFVDDSELRTLMVERSWIAEGIAFCTRAKSSGTNANLGPTTTNFDALVANWTGTAKWKKEVGAVETRVFAPLTLDIAADGSVSGRGQGCGFSGRLQSGDGFRSHFTASISATGCTDASFNGTYRRFDLERYSGGTLMVKMKVGDGATEASIEAELSSSIALTTPATSLASAGIPGDWSGTVGWIALRRQGGIETILVTANRPLSLAISPAGTLTGSGFGCTLTGSIAPVSVAGIFGGSVSASGCTESAFNGAYANVKVKRDDGKLEVEFEKESEAAGVTTKAKVDGSLLNTAAMPGAPADPRLPSAGIAGRFSGAFTAAVEIRNRSGGANTTSTASYASTAQFTVTAVGAITGSGFGCAFSGSLSPSGAVSGVFSGVIGATGCTTAELNGTYAASAHAEDAGALSLEMERESEVANIRTKVKIRGTGARTGS